MSTFNKLFVKNLSFKDIDSKIVILPNNNTSLLISDEKDDYLVLDTTNKEILLKQNTSITGTLSMNNNKITNIATPSLNADCINKLYSDTATQLNATNLTNYINSQTWYTYNSLVESNEVLKEHGLSDILGSDTTKVVVSELGTYRVNFCGQYKIAIGNCDCKDDLNSMINDIKNNTFTNHVPEYGSTTILAGNYFNSGATTHTGVVTFDGNGNSNSIFIIHSVGAHALAVNASTVLINGAKSSNIFWYIEGALSMGTGCNIKGVYITDAAIGAGTPLTIEGHLFSSGGAVALGALTGTVPIGTSPITMGGLKNLLIMTVAGAISATSYTSSTAEVFAILTELGVVSGFGVPFDGTYPSLNEPYIRFNVGVYKNTTLATSSLMYRNYNKIVTDKIINIDCVITVSTELEKTINVRTEMVSLLGGIIFNNRNLFVYRLT
jgi:hypothetical protein